MIGRVLLRRLRDARVFPVELSEWAWTPYAQAVIGVHPISLVRARSSGTPIEGAVVEGGVLHGFMCGV